MSDVTSSTCLFAGRSAQDRPTEPIPPLKKARHGVALILCREPFDTHKTRSRTSTDFVVLAAEPLRGPAGELTRMPTEDDDDASMPSLWPCEDTFLLSHSDSGPRWKCDWCGGLEFLALGERWRCRRCGSFDYHEAASSGFEDLSGQDRSWTWTPSDATIPPSSTTPPVFSRPMDPRPPRQQSARDESLRTNWDFGPPSEWDEQEYGARSESNMTNDPEVNPDTLQPEPHLSRRQRRAARQAGTPRPQETPRHGAPEPQIPQIPVGRSARAPRAPNGPGGPPVDPPSRGGRTPSGLPAGSPSVGGGPRVALPGGSPLPTWWTAIWRWRILFIEELMEQQERP